MFWCWIFYRCQPKSDRTTCVFINQSESCWPLPELQRSFNSVRRAVGQKSPSNRTTHSKKKTHQQTPPPGMTRTRNTGTSTEPRSRHRTRARCRGRVRNKRAVNGAVGAASTAAVTSQLTLAKNKQLGQRSNTAAAAAPTSGHSPPGCFLHSLHRPTAVNILILMTLRIIQ